MPFKDRQREWLSPLIIIGLPWFRASSYVNSRLKQYREEHPDFNLYLKELLRLIKDHNPSEDYKPIIQLLDNDICWIDKNLINTFIKLYNLCLSPKQTFDYINDCYNLYLFIKNNKYSLNDYFEVYIRKCSWDAKTRKFIEVVLFPEAQIDEHLNHYFFRITFPSLIVSNGLGPYINQNDIKIELVNNYQDKFNDALVLFEYSHEKTLLKTIFNNCIKQLEELNVIELANRKARFEEISESEYDVPFEVGQHEFNKKK